MRILHTSDWHIGKRLMTRLRLDEQEEVLEEILSICNNNNIDIVLVAGDVFDTYLPPADAEDLFFKMITKFAENGRAVVIISGNHDDNVRLSASTPLAEKNGIYIIGNINQIPSINLTRRIKIVSSGACYLVLENENGERVYLNTLPFPNESRFNESKNEDESYLDKMKRWSSIGEKEFKGDMPYIFMSHLFVAGGQVCDSERRIDVGGERAVPLSALPDADYIALGHLHKRQVFSQKKVIYSGSILQYAFDEANTKKSVTIFDATENGIENIQEIELLKGKKLVRLESNSVGDGLDLLQKYSDGCFIELTLNLKEPLTTLETKALQEQNGNLISLKTNILSQDFNGDITSKRDLSSKELFEEYYKSLYEVEPPQELMSLYLELLETEDEA